MRRFLLTLLMLLVLGMLIFVATGCGSDNQADGIDEAGSKVGAVPMTPVANRSRAPSFTGQTLSGFNVSLESFTGEPLALIFWASW